jgi:hypothetical protein
MIERAHRQHAEPLPVTHGSGCYAADSTVTPRGNQHFISVVCSVLGDAANTMAGPHGKDLSRHSVVEQQFHQPGVRVVPMRPRAHVKYDGDFPLIVRSDVAGCQTDLAVRALPKPTVRNAVSTCIVAVLRFKV